MTIPPRLHFFLVATGVCFLTAIIFVHPHDFLDVLAAVIASLIGGGAMVFIDWIFDKFS